MADSPGMNRDAPPAAADPRATSPGNDGFTLLELVFVLAIIALVMGLAAFSLAEFGQTRAIDSARAELTFLVRQARLIAGETGETAWLVFTKDRFGLMAEGVAPESVAWVPLNEVKLRIRRAGDTEWREPEAFFWEFTPRQIGEPLAIRLTGSGADLAVEFSALTGEGRILETARLR